MRDPFSSRLAQVGDALVNPAVARRVDQRVCFVAAGLAERPGLLEDTSAAVTGSRKPNPKWSEELPMSLSFQVLRDTGRENTLLESADSRQLVSKLLFECGDGWLPK